MKMKDFRRLHQDDLSVFLERKFKSLIEVTRLIVCTIVINIRIEPGYATVRIYQVFKH
jgi:hypothetical protein